MELPSQSVGGKVCNGSPGEIRAKCAFVFGPALPPERIGEAAGVCANCLDE
jgi:hypothetical protein